MLEHLSDAVVRAGATLCDIGDADALMWADPAAADTFPDVMAQAPNVRWIQLPYAGLETFAHHLSPDYVWTCGKGVYADPVAEHVIGLALAGFRNIGAYATARSWGAPVGQNLIGAKVTILGGGGITESLLPLLAPFDCTVSVLRRQPREMPGVDRVVGPDGLDDVLADADLVVVALSLTPETRHILDRRTLALMKPNAWLINVGRGGHIATDDLVEALRSGVIAGAALDVTEPEPLPTGHPLWDLPNCIITPHIANTPDMGVVLLAQRVEQNVRRYMAGEALLGPVDVELGY